MVWHRYLSILNVKQFFFNKKCHHMWSPCPDQILKLCWGPQLWSHLTLQGHSQTFSLGVLPFPPLPSPHFSSSPFSCPPPLSFPFPPIIQLGALRECCELPKRVTGQSPCRKCILGIFRGQETFLVAWHYLMFFVLLMGQNLSNWSKSVYSECTDMLNFC